ncbi:MAG TPA: WYL domain-containing protein [Mycobacteriales bacterium]|jgi:predicted DNA-binding transcriptional regulator YafY|nr:WYL domain-containing protein [Mycobacteriales bacterium]
MRASRLLTILLILQTRGRVTAGEMAAELEVSTRTVYRDIESLAAAGIPVYADRGPTGGYQLVDGFRTRLTGLTGEEADALFLAGLPEAAAELGLGTVLAATELKLLAALPPELRSRAGRIRERFHLDAPGWFRDSDDTPHLAAVADAVWKQHRIEITYLRSWRPAEVTRVLEPLGLVLKAGVWYVAAQESGKPRSYRISRITTLSVLAEHFQRPGDFNLAAFWAARSEHLRDHLYRSEAVIRLSPRGQELAFLLGQVARRAVTDTAGEPDTDGWIKARIPTESDRHAVHELLRLGAEVEVLEPVAVREEIGRAARALTELYG